ncbi:MAG: hypothetical protein FJ264_12115 [Planctomycetes bacterium]|nr:hypothetical protein [Planctomycetota bacterium]
MKKFIFTCFLVFLFTSLVSGKENLLTPQASIVYPSGSCIDRCHVNYLNYRTKYKEEVFWHKSHSSSQNMECCECHNNDPVNTKAHGGLIIEENDCKKCHHKEADNEACMKCHFEINDYRNGTFQIDMNCSGTKIPDWMYKAVQCTDCHKQAKDAFLFQDIRNVCIECHNSDYGLLYDKWKEVLQEETQAMMHENKKNSKMQSHLKQLQQYGIHNIRLSRTLLERVKKEKGISAKE